MLIAANTLHSETFLCYLLEKQDSNFIFLHVSNEKLSLVRLA